MKKIVMALVAIGLSAFSVASMAAGEIGLIKSESRSSYYMGYSWSDGRFQAQVTNLGANKQVFAHVKKADGTWVDFPMYYIYSSGANKEVWRANFSTDYAGNTNLPGIGPVYEFALKYQVNGQTYWDNNGNANYKMPRGDGTLLGKGVNVVVDGFIDEMPMPAGFTEWKSHITVRNIAPVKNVKVVYTTDNWATTKVVSAVYSPSSWSSTGFDTTANPNSMGFEEWNFSLPVTDGTVVKYAISYTVNGQTYWDNNFGLNYTTHFYNQLTGKRSG